jgi:tryptophan synthase beta chain
MRAREEGKEKVILLNYSGHGLMDLSGYEKFLDGELIDYALSDRELEASLKWVKDLPEAAIRKTGKW